MISKHIYHLKKKKLIALLFIVWSFLTYATSTTAQTAPKKKPTSKKHVKHKRKPKPQVVIPEFTLSGKILLKEEFCDEEASKEIIKPCLEKTFFIKKGDANSAKNPVIDALHVDSTGAFSMRLKSGKYCILQDFQTRALALENYTSSEKFEYLGNDCMRKYWADCYLDIVLDKDINNLVITYSKKCHQSDNPCMKSLNPNKQQSNSQ